MNLILVMGVSGTGKSTIAEELAKKLHYNFLDADDFHSDKAKEMMSSGQPINDEIRKVWIENMLDFFNYGNRTEQNFVLAYSGLKATQREKFNTLSQKVMGIFLHGDKALISKRMASRSGHFFSNSLLDNQFDVLELPKEGSIENISLINVNQSVEEITKEAMTYIQTQVSKNEN